MDPIDLIEAMAEFPEWADSWGRIIFTGKGVESLWSDLEIAPTQVASGLGSGLDAWYISSEEAIHAANRLRELRKS